MTNNYDAFSELDASLVREIIEGNSYLGSTPPPNAFGDVVSEEVLLDSSRPNELDREAFYPSNSTEIGEDFAFYSKLIRDSYE